jgi:hypothetical protein
VVSATNNYGPIGVKPSGNNQVVVTTVSYSDELSFLNEQHGTRIQLRAESKRVGTPDLWTKKISRRVFIEDKRKIGHL